MRGIGFPVTLACRMILLWISACSNLCDHICVCRGIHLQIELCRSEHGTMHMFLLVISWLCAWSVMNMMKTILDFYAKAICPCNMVSYLACCSVVLICKPLASPSLLCKCDCDCVVCGCVWVCSVWGVQVIVWMCSVLCGCTCVWSGVGRSLHTHPITFYWPLITSYFITGNRLLHVRRKKTILDSTKVN